MAGVGLEVAPGEMRAEACLAGRMVTEGTRVEAATAVVKAATGMAEAR